MHAADELVVRGLRRELNGRGLLSERALADDADIIREALDGAKTAR